MVSKKLQHAFIVASLGLGVSFLTSCSSKGDDEQKDLENKDEEAAKPPSNNAEPLAQQNEQPINAAGDPPPAVNAATAPDPTAAPMPVEQAPPVHTGSAGNAAASDRSQMMVMYVPGTAAVHSQPDRNSAATRTLERGDHILVRVSGEWAQTSSAEYISASELTASPIGRKRTSSSWRGL